MRTPRLFLGIFVIALIVPLLMTACGGPPLAQIPPKSEADREALVALYNATGGPNWVDNDNWLSDVPISGWYGVTTDDITGRVTELDLSYNQLSGRYRRSWATSPTWKGCTSEGTS